MVGEAVGARGASLVGTSGGRTLGLHTVTGEIHLILSYLILSI